jgi:SEC-C motif-containing protein
MKQEKAAPCPCGSGESYDDCCGPVHQGAETATAEALMRSRYSAYVLGLESYLLATWHPSTRPAALNLVADATTRWIDLSVKDHQPTGESTAEVEFIARYKINGRAHRLHERSRFVREAGRWYYLAGEFPADG